MYTGLNSSLKITLKQNLKAIFKEGKLPPPKAKKKKKHSNKVLEA